MPGEPEVTVTSVTFRLTLPFLQSNVTDTESPGLMSFNAAGWPSRVIFTPSGTANDTLRRAIFEGLTERPHSAFTPNRLAVKLTTVP